MLTRLDIAEKCLESINALHTQAQALFSATPCETDALQSRLDVLKTELAVLAQEENAMQALALLHNIRASLQRARKEADAQRLAYETIPLLKELQTDIRFWGLCYPDIERMRRYYATDMRADCPLPDTFTKEVSIVVLAYNKLEYTKQCIENLRKYLPQDMDYELILVNNGSSDGTAEYFDAIPADKRIQLARNIKSFGCVSRCLQGRYLLWISNDVLITPQSIENLLTCIRSAEDIACVVPVCPNVSNLQRGRYLCPSIELLEDFARWHNISNPALWEQRVRLVPPLLLARSDAEAVHAFLGYRYPFFPERFLAFTDDLMALRMRRNGQRGILAKDVYVHHYGSITVGYDAGLYTRGREAFRRAFGVDPWGTGAWYDPALMDRLPPERKPPISILGVNSGFGSNPVKVRELYRERALPAALYFATNQAQYLPDQLGLSESVEYKAHILQLPEAFAGENFDYIVIDDGTPRTVELHLLFRAFEQRLKPGGTLALHCAEEAQRLALITEPGVRIAGNWICKEG